MTATLLPDSGLVQSARYPNCLPGAGERWVAQQRQYSYFVRIARSIVEARWGLWMRNLVGWMDQCPPWALWMRWAPDSIVGDNELIEISHTEYRVGPVRNAVPYSYEKVLPIAHPIHGAHLPWN